MFTRRLAIALGTSTLFVLLASTLSAQTLATGDSRRFIPEPRYPMVCTALQAQFSSTQRATPPASDDTARLASALSSCSGSGKAVLLLASGLNDAFYSGKLSLNGEALIVGHGVTLFGNNTYGSSGELISVSGNNPAIFGPGVIDGRGDLISGTPRLINSKNAVGLTVYNVTLQHAAKMHLYVEGGSDFTALRVRIETPANTKNTDGIDIDSLTNATVAFSSIEDGDDGVAIKTNSGPASNITIRDNRFYGTHGISIGSQTMRGVINVLFENNMLFGTDKFGNVSTDNNGINIKSDYDCGGLVKQVTYRQTHLTGVKHLLIFNTSYGSCSGTKGIPVYQDIVVDGVYARDSQSGAYSEFEGYNAANPLELYLAHVYLDVNSQQKSQYANVGLDDSTITPTGTGVTTFPFNLHHDE
jgi:polygalacturonase